jgi:putative transposase
LEDGKVQLEAQVNGAITTSTCDELLEIYAERKLSFPGNPAKTGPALSQAGRALSTFSESVQQKAIRKKQYLDFILSAGTFISTPKILKPLLDECAQIISDAKPPCVVTAYRWYRAFVRNQRDNRALIDRHDRKGGGGSRLRPEVAVILQASIDDIYLSEQRNSGVAVYYDVINRINKENEFRATKDKLSVPSRATIFRALGSIDKYDGMAARFGDRIAKMKFRTSGLGIRPARILERVEIDHTPLDLFVIDQETGLPQGRPTVTFAIDVYSKMIIGMHIGFTGTSVEAVFACLRHALTPKTYIKKSYPEIEHDWPCHGHIETLVCDNGMEFHSKELERVAFELGTMIQYCPKRQAYYKGSIERVLKTLNYQFSRSLPGHSFAKWFHREDYDPLKDAVITFDQLMRYLHRWLIDIYAQQLHRGINSSPHRRWVTGAVEMPPKLLSDLKRLDIVLGRTCERTLFHYGVEVNNLLYNDQALLMLRRQYGESVKVEVRYYFDDISSIHVIDPMTKEAIFVPALDQKYSRGLSLEQHRLICARAREVNSGSINLAGIARAKAEIREIVKELSISKLQHKRQRAAKIKGVGQANSSTPLSEPPKEINPDSSPSSPSENVPTADLLDFGTLIFSRLPKSLEL